MHFTTFFTLLAAGYGAVAQTPTDPDVTSETVTATPTPPKEPGTSFSCLSTTISGEVVNSEGVCSAAGGKFNIFSGCCMDTAASGAEASYTQGCSDNGGTVRKSQSPCDLAA